THFCIQGWSGVAEWGGVPMRDILDLVKPLPEARYAVFYSLADGADGGRYYDVHKIENMRHELTVLAYEMNGDPLYGSSAVRARTVPGAPNRSSRRPRAELAIWSWFCRKCKNCCPPGVDQVLTKARYEKGRLAAAFS